MRFIPARAGNTATGKRTPAVVIGSSPPARGTPGRGDRLCAGQRFIPARAGNTGEGNDRRTTVEVHPRPRGEHSLSSLSMAVSAGSSPPARGTLGGHLSHSFLRRFIPARAGNTDPLRRSLWPAPVHPRPRGEHTLVHDWTMDIDGSSPPARGTLISPSGNARGLRFIPARAGNTWSCRHSPRSSPVHPRPRGEHQHHHSSRPSRAGSSPPARGTPEEQA